MIKAVIFDLGGVLMRTVDPAPRQQLAECLGKSLNELYHLVFSSDSAYQATLGKISAREHWEAVRTSLGLTQDEFSAVVEQFWAGDRLDYDLIDYLRALRPRYKTALLSNAWDDLRYFIEAEWKIADAFDEIIISAEVGLAKPDRRIFQLALDRLGVSAPQAVFVDDFPENVEAAQSLGLHALRFRTPQQTRLELGFLLNGRGEEA
jgi:epoxide hydrolase-like predicted phosphatase